MKKMEKQSNYQILKNLGISEAEIREAARLGLKE